MLDTPTWWWFHWWGSWWWRFPRVQKRLRFLLLWLLNRTVPSPVRSLSLTPLTLRSSWRCCYILNHRCNRSLIIWHWRSWTSRRWISSIEKRHNIIVSPTYVASISRFLFILFLCLQNLHDFGNSSTTSLSTFHGG